MHLLDSVNSPADLRALSPDELPVLAAQIREFLIPAVARTGGHLGPNLGVVELTIALHRVFDSPRDALLWDTGHQTYVHKILTGRRDAFTTLRQPGGLSGYPSRAESPHDWIENSHASTALSYADGLAKAWDLTGELGQRRVVAIVGDGSLTGGMAWEALNTIAAHDRQVIVVVNDNARSYAPTIGGLAQHLATLRTTRGYERLLHWGRDTLTRTPVVGAPVYGTLHGLKKGMKDMFAPQGLFEDLGLKYIGPIDGHDIDLLERTLARAAGYPGPVIVHCLTEKGRGYRPAEEDEADRFHGIGVIDPVTGQPTTAAAPTWTGAFSAALLDQAAQRPEVVAITAAMPGPTGLAPFAERYPRRYYDVGIAEQHAVTSAAGLALGGRHPVVALYATFLNRAYDQVLLDVAMHKLPVTFVLDRAGITGDDGPSHNGMWDLSMLAGVPGLRVAAPRDGDTLRDELADALGDAAGPTALRFPKGPLPAPLPALRRRGDVDVLAHWGDRVLIVAVGALAHEAVAAAELLHHDGVDATVVDPRWVLPVSEGVLDLARAAELVVVAEDNSRHGGVAAAVARLLPGRTVLGLGIEPRFQPQGRRAELLAAAGLTAAGIAEAVAKATLALPDVGD